MARAAKQEKHSNPRLEARLGHVGYYLVAEGLPALEERVGFQPPLGRRIASFLRRHPSEFYLPGTEVLTLAIMSAIVLLLTNTYTSPELIFFSMLMLLLPCSQGAIQLVNYLVTSLAGAANSSQARFLGGRSSHLRHPGGDSQPAVQPRTSEPAGGRSRSPIPGKSRSQYLFRPAHRSARFQRAFATRTIR